jgi:dienelactone hydrolase
MKTVTNLAFTWLALAAPLSAIEETLPPLKNGKAPQSVDELWGGYDPRKEPLEIEVLKEWEQDGLICRVIRYQVGVFKGAPAKVVAFYAFPKNSVKLPAILQLHGGGGAASLSVVTTEAKRGYASLSLNWGGNKMSLGNETWSGPQTDWGNLDATHPPQRNKKNHFAGALTPDEFTLDAIESPRNSNWFLVLIAARRALTFLEQQPEVDPAKMGVTGHSMGGKLTVNLAGIDERIRAAVPSCGGSGELLDTHTDAQGGVRTKPTALELACIADNAYIPRITCPLLWLSPTNDFHAVMDNMTWNWRNIPDERVRFSISPHLNHHHRNENNITSYLWFEQYLKQAFTVPQTPEMSLTNVAGVPRINVTPDPTVPVKRVEVYYSTDPHTLTRFWRSAEVTQEGGVWSAACSVMSLNEPLFAFANVTYELPARYQKIAQVPGSESTDCFVISSREIAVGPKELQATGIKATDLRDRMIDDGRNGWRNWYQLNWGHPPLWYAVTRKLKDPKWRGPDGAKLVFEIQSHSDNSLVVTVNCNAWGAFLTGKPAVDYSVVKDLKGSPDWQTITVTLEELLPTNPGISDPLPNWQTVTELKLSPSGEVVKGGLKEKIVGAAWQGPREIRNLRWEGGQYAAQQSAGGTLSEAEQQKQFNDSIKASLEQEKIQAK